MPVSLSRDSGCFIDKSATPREMRPRETIKPPGRPRETEKSGPRPRLLPVSLSRDSGCSEMRVVSKKPTDRSRPMINHSKKRREGKDQEQQGQAVTPEEEVQNAHVDPKRNHRPVVRFPQAREVTKTARVERRKRAKDFVIPGHDLRDGDHESPSSKKKNKKETKATSRRGQRTQRCRWNLPENLSDSDLKPDNDEGNSVGSRVAPSVMSFDDSEDSDSDGEVEGSRTRLD